MMAEQPHPRSGGSPFYLLGVTMICLLWFIVLLSVPAIAVALDTSDGGTYAVIHRDGHITDFTFFVSFSNSTWNVEQRKPDGTWSSVTCERDCILQNSQQQDISRFFPVSFLTTATPSCVHNTAFAFCNYTFRSQPKNKDHILIVLATPQPTPLI